MRGKEVPAGPHSSDKQEWLYNKAYPLPLTVLHSLTPPYYPPSLSHSAPLPHFQILMGYTSDIIPYGEAAFNYIQALIDNAFNNGVSDPGQRESGKAVWDIIEETLVSVTAYVRCAKVLAHS